MLNNSATHCEFAVEFLCALSFSSNTPVFFPIFDVTFLNTIRNKPMGQHIKATTSMWSVEREIAENWHILCFLFELIV